MVNNLDNNTNNEKKEDVKKQDIKKLILENKLLIILCLLSITIICVKQYDKKHNNIIKVEVDSKDIKNFNNEIKDEKLKIFVYNNTNKNIEEIEVMIPKQVNLIEGDYIQSIIDNSNYLPENSKFISAYKLKIEDKNTLIIKLSSEFLTLESEQELLKGFYEAITRTMLSVNPKIENIKIEIDGDTKI